METTIHPARCLSGSLTVPGDKSVAHRALIFGALGRGQQKIHNLPPSEDVASTTACLRALGVRIEGHAEGEVRVAPGAWVRGHTLNAGNSGTTARLLAGLAAGLDLGCTLTGDDSLRRRPMGRIARPLIEMGATIELAEGDRLPMRIRGGRLTGISYASPVASAQVKSAILIAGLFARGRTTVIEPAPSRDHTENLLQAMGIPVERDGCRVTVTGGSRPRGITLAIPGDISSAAFFLVAGSIVPNSEIRLPGTGVNPTRTGLLETLCEMGADISTQHSTEQAGEAVAELVVRAHRLRGVEIAGRRIPRLIDELPVIAVAASQAEGVTTVRDAGELRHKESDRIRAIVRSLAAVGGDIEEREDGFIVRGPRRLRGGCVSSGGDHRIAMAMTIAALVADKPITIQDSEAVGVSYPSFFQDLRELAQ